MSKFPSERFLQNAIIVMSALFVAGLAILVYGLVKKSGSETSIASEAPMLTAATAPRVNSPSIVVSPNTKTITLPARSNIRQIATYQGGLAIYTSSPQGQYVYFVNAEKGTVDGALRIDTARDVRPIVPR